MKRLLIGFLVVVIMLSAVGCAQPSYTSSPEPPVPHAPPTPTIPPGDKPPPEDMTWISPGKVMVSNFYPGARAEYPLLIHNGNDYTTEQKLVTTEKGETLVLVTLSNPLFGDYSDIQVGSSLIGDRPAVLTYTEDTQGIIITGLLENHERILTVTYKYFATFEIKYRYPDHVGEDYVKPPEETQDWVIIADPTPVIAPKETREILIVLAMPEDAAVFAPEWEFWISVRDTTQTGMVQTELCSRWLVCMR